jgi:DNA-binding MarR family transcriptional regulator
MKLSNQNDSGGGSWTFLTSHGQVLLYIASHPGTRVRDIAYDLDITERRVYLILRELEDTGYITRRRHGNRVARDVTIRQLLELLGAGDTQ